MKKTPINIQVPEPLKKKAVRQARKQGYSLTHWIREAIEEKLAVTK